MSSSLRARQAAEVSREDAILDTVTDLLVEHGYAGLTYDEVARRAHVGKATLYSRWPGKAELVVEALRREHERGPDGAGDGDAGTGSLRDDLLGLCRTMLDDRERTARLLLALATAVQSDARVAEAVEEHLGSQFRRRSRRILDAAVARGELADTVHDLPYTVDLLPAIAVTRLLLAPRAALDADDIVDHLLLPVLTQSV